MDKQQRGEQKKDERRVRCYACNEFGHYDGQCPNKKRGKQEMEEQVAATAKIESFAAKFDIEFSLVIVVSSYGSSRPMDVGKWIVENVYFEHMIGM